MQLIASNPAAQQRAHSAQLAGAFESPGVRSISSVSGRACGGWAKHIDVLSPRGISQQRAVSLCAVAFTLGQRAQQHAAATAATAAPTTSAANGL